jgi:CheY-like chemotaxis protein
LSANTNTSNSLADHVRPVQSLFTQDIISLTKPKRTYSVKSITTSTDDDSELDILVPLVVDGISSNRKMLQMLLKMKGIDAVLANDGIEALDIVKANIDVYKLIFMDNVMPRLDGLEATRKLRELDYKYLIVGLTGNVLDEDVDEFLTAGVDLVLMKPLDISILDNLLGCIEENGAFSKSGMKLMQENETFGWVFK